MTTAYTATRFEYAQNGRTVVYALKESWCWDREVECPPGDKYSVDHVEHYRYDGARQRYLVQVLDPDDPDPTDPENVLSERWSDYDGDDVYGDFEIDEGNAVTVRSFEPGIARVTAGVSDGALRQCLCTTNVIAYAERHSASKVRTGVPL